MAENRKEWPLEGYGNDAELENIAKKEVPEFEER